MASFVPFWSRTTTDRPFQVALYAESGPDVLTGSIISSRVVLGEKIVLKVVEAVSGLGGSACTVCWWVGALPPMWASTKEIAKIQVAITKSEMGENLCIKFILSLILSMNDCLRNLHDNVLTRPNRRGGCRNGLRGKVTFVRTSCSITTSG